MATEAQSPRPASVSYLHRIWIEGKLVTALQMKSWDFTVGLRNVLWWEKRGHQGPRIARRQNTKRNLVKW